tara:strand:- start:1091 stop:1906 length:816 start_codon:yes stop_codon:yes gene_type:complete
MWHWLPPELRRLVLQCLSLPQLRLLKTVSRSMATDCRTVLRSKAWQIRGANHYAMEEELKTQLHTYRLPLLVSCFPNCFPKTAPCLAVIHRLRLNRLNSYGDAVNADDVTTWGYTRDSSDLSTIVSDMCIEVRGHGICGSMTTLRQVLQEAVRMRGVEGASWSHQGTEWTTEKVAEGLWTYEVTEYDGEEEGNWSVGLKTSVSWPGGKVLVKYPEEVPTAMVLECLEFVTFTRERFGMDNECPCSMENWHDYCGNMDPLYMCRLGSKLFVR